MIPVVPTPSTTRMGGCPPPGCPSAPTRPTVGGKAKKDYFDRPGSTPGLVEDMLGLDAYPPGHLDTTRLLWRAERRDDLFAAAVPALLACLTDPASVFASESRWIEVAAVDEDRLMHAWIDELVRIFDTEGTLFRHAETKVIRRSPAQLALLGQLWGEPIDPTRHVIEASPLATVDVGVERVAEGWEASLTMEVQPMAAGG